MPDRDTYNVLLVLIAIVLLFGGLSVAYTNASTTQTVTDEVVTVNYSNPSVLDTTEYAVNYSDTITITADGSKLANGTDYTWNASSGRITWLNSTNTTSGETALADYQYSAPSKNTRERMGVLQPVVRILPYAALLMAVYLALDLAEEGF